MPPSDIPDRFAFKSLIPAPAQGWISPGDSVIVDPDGKVIAGPMHQEQGLLFAELDPQKMTGPPWQLDVAGHYARTDVLDLVRRGRAAP